MVTLDGEVETDPQRKMEIFKQAFFPPAPEVDLSDIRNYRYCEAHILPPITQDEVKGAIQSMSGKKAPGADKIPSHLLQKILYFLLPNLHWLYNACLDLQYCPRHFRESITVILRKPAWGNYTQAKAY